MPGPPGPTVDNTQRCSETGESKAGQRRAPVVRQRHKSAEWSGRPPSASSQRRDTRRRRVRPRSVDISGAAFPSARRIDRYFLCFLRFL
ncbi:predicted protein [Streptomyces viridochromogenes DSM 40736]|uniref:Predicted protein n=1 Tax=Streptomyces viridochromogenes (strain DSM 40736 / JCM 4977 / BCRC 1201 / Tue 494) TaxID=591159 RepID=D9XHY1_STRVT|nr:predicted protein [Streptomyces viridochromogenes DSM 40736]